MLSIKTKLIILIIGLVVAAHFATSALIINQVEEAMHHENHRRGLALTLDLAHTSTLSLISHDLAELRHYVGFSMQQQYVVQAMVVDTSWRIIMHNDLRQVGTTYKDPGQLTAPSYSEDYQFNNGEQVLDIRVPIEVAGVTLGAAIISYSHAGVKKELATLKKKIILTFTIGTCVAIICAVVLGQYITRPLKHLCNVAANLGRGCFDIKRMETEYTDEIGELTRTFYDMAGKLEKEVCHDSLTGLFTRNIFQIRLSEECAQSLRHQQPLALMMTDIDHFKAVNDTYGHVAGDKVLQEIAHILQEVVRGEDCVARYGGEEFVLLLPQTPKLGALRVAEKLRQMVEECPFKIEGQQAIFLTISIGISLFPDDTKNIQELIELADQALYAAKKSGRNRVCLAPVCEA